MKRTCKQCGKEFFISQSEINFYKSKNLQIPRRCKECRDANKQQTADLKEYGKGKQEGNQNRENTGKKDNMEKPEAVISTPPIQNTEQKPEQPSSNVTIEKGKKNTGFATKMLTFAAIAVILIVSQIVMPRSSDDASQTEATGNLSVNSHLAFRSEEYLNSHYQKHGIEMGFSSAEEYQAAAAAVVESEDALHKTEAEDGDDVYYIERTNEFVIVSTDGYIRTYFYPDDGIDYFNRQ